MLEFAGRAGCCKATSIELAWRMCRASRSFLVLLQSLLLEPFRDISSPTTASIHIFQDLLPVYCQKRSHHSARKDISSDNTVHNLCTQSHRAHVRLCLTPVSKSRLRPSCNKQYKAAGLTGRTRKICPKKRSTETTSVAFSNSPCKFRLISLPIY